MMWQCEQCGQWIREGIFNQEGSFCNEHCRACYRLPASVLVGQYLIAAGMLALGSQLSRKLRSLSGRPQRPQRPAGQHRFTVEIEADGEFVGTVESMVGLELQRRPIQGSGSNRYELAGTGVSVWVSPVSRNDRVRVRLLKNGETVMARNIQAFQGRVVLASQ